MPKNVLINSKENEVMTTQAIHSARSTAETSETSGSATMFSGKIGEKIEVARFERFEVGS